MSMRVRLFHPAKFSGDIVAVRVREYFRDGVNGDQLLVDVADRERVHHGLVVRQGGLVNQWIGWRGAGAVVGEIGQIGSGYTNPWQLHPLPEAMRPDVEAFLQAEHIVHWRQDDLREAS